MRLALALLFATTLSAQSFTIRCTANTRVLYEATVDGATDFDVMLRDAHFELNAAFTSEGEELRVRLQTRRRHGTSSNKLPLWEEDVQQHRLRVRTGQRVELLPFGSAGPRGLLKLDVLPDVGRASARPGRAEARPTIEITKANDAISVRAHRLPHWYEVRARLDNSTANAVVFARDTARLNLGDATLTIAMEPAPYRDARTATLVKFDGKWKNGAWFARGWEGIASGQPLRYAIGNKTLILEVIPKE